MNSKSSSKNHRTFAIKIQTNKGPITINCAEVVDLPTISMVGIDKIAKVLNSNNVAIGAPPPLMSCLDGNIKIDILVGADAYFDLMLNNPYEEHGDLKLLDSHFGRILAGKYTTDYRNIACCNMITVLNVSSNVDIICQNLYSSGEGIDKVDLTNNDLSKLFALDSYGKADTLTDVTDIELINQFNS